MDDIFDCLATGLSVDRHRTDKCVLQVIGEWYILDCDDGLLFQDGFFAVFRVN